MDKIVRLAENFCAGEYEYDIDDATWKDTFEYLIKHAEILTINKSRVHTLWTVNGGHIRRKIANDDLVLSVLEKSLPNYDGDGLTLYRGECKFLYDSNKIGFCWTPDIAVATRFARGLNAIESGGVLLKAFAPKSAILCSPNEHSVKQMQEHEFTCNPNLLESIELIQSFEKP